jgi:hypothetical protein
MRRLLRRLQATQHPFTFIAVACTALLLVVGTTVPNFRIHAAGAVASILLPRAAGCAAGNNGSLTSKCSGEQAIQRYQDVSGGGNSCTALPASTQAVSLAAAACSGQAAQQTLRSVRLQLQPTMLQPPLSMLLTCAAAVDAQGQVAHLSPAAPKHW